MPGAEALYFRGGVVVAKVELRPEVQWFAEQVELCLRANDHKGGWQEDSAMSLWGRINDEWHELHNVLSLDNLVMLLWQLRRRPTSPTSQ